MEMKTILDASQLMPFANAANRSLPKLNGNWTRQIQHFYKKLNNKQNLGAAVLIKNLLINLQQLQNKGYLRQAIEIVIKYWGHLPDTQIPTIQKNAIELNKIWTEFKTNADGVINILFQVEERNLKRLAQVVSRDIDEIKSSLGNFIEPYCTSLNATSATTAPTNVDSGEWYIVEDNFSTAQSENKMQKLADDFANKLDELIK